MKNNNKRNAVLLKYPCNSFKHHLLFIEHCLQLAHLILSSKKEPVKKINYRYSITKKNLFLREDKMNSQKFYLIILSVLFFFSNSVAQFEWEMMKIPCPGGIPSCMYMDAKTEDVYAGCYGGIWKLDKSTNTWSLVDGGVQDSSILANAKITALYLDIAGVFFAGCDSNTPSYISYNRGKTWQQIQDISFTLQSINCIVEHPDGSVLLGASGGIIKTSDHGKSWSKLQNSPTYAKDFYVDHGGAIYCVTASSIYKSTDSGSSWLEKDSGIVHLPFSSIKFNSKGVGFASANGDMYKTINGGDGWLSLKSVLLPIMTRANIATICILKNDDILISTDGYGPAICISSDEGNSWSGVSISGTFSHIGYFQILADSNSNIYARTLVGPVLGTYTTSVNIADQNIPSAFSVSQNYPNPFNPTTKISFSLPQKSQIKLKVFDVLGREIQILADGIYEAGKHEAEFYASNLSSGVYFYNLSDGTSSITKKMLLIK